MNRTTSELTDQSPSDSAKPSDVSPINDSLKSFETLNVLNLEANDFPDVCIHCEKCMSQIRQVIEQRTKKHIKDADIAHEFTELATAQLVKFFK